MIHNSLIHYQRLFYMFFKYILDICDHCVWPYHLHSQRAGAYKPSSPAMPQLQPKRPGGPRPSPHPPPPQPITLDPSKASCLSFLFIVKSRDVLMLTSWKCMADRLPRSQRASEWISQLDRTLEFSCRICSSNTVIATCKPFNSLLSFYTGANLDCCHIDSPNFRIRIYFR